MLILFKLIKNKNFGTKPYGCRATKLTSIWFTLRTRIIYLVGNSNHDRNAYRRNKNDWLW